MEESLEIAGSPSVVGHGLSARDWSTMDKSESSIRVQESDVVGMARLLGYELSAAERAVVMPVIQEFLRCGQLLEDQSTTYVF